MNARLYSWSFVLMFLAFSIFLSYVTGSFIFLMVAVFPFAGKMMFGPRDERSTEAVRRAMKKRRTWFLLALVAAMAYFGFVLVTNDSAGMAIGSIVGLGLLAIIYVAMVIGAGQYFDNDHHDNYG